MNGSEFERLQKKAFKSRNFFASGSVPCFRCQRKKLLGVLDARLDDSCTNLVMRELSAFDVDGE